MTHESSDELLFEDGPPADPCLLAAEWFEYAKAHSGEHNWHKFMLATADRESLQPGVRAVLLKNYGHDTGEITFYTNYSSRKAREMDANPRIGACFHWDAIERQIRVEGRVRKAPEDVSDAYFASRGRESQIGAWASAQSEELDGWEDLLGQVMHYAMKFPTDKPVPRPPHWGGYIIAPTLFEFWHGRTGRVHERIGYYRQNPLDTNPPTWRSAWLNP